MKPPRAASPAQSHDGGARARICLRTLGDPALLRWQPDGQPKVVIEPSKLLALVVYLACSPGRTATRDGLIDLLWADLEPEAGRHALRQHLWQLKRRLGDELVVEGRDQLVLKSPIDSDRAQFIAASETSHFARAVELYTGDFFPGFAGAGAAEFERWVDNERAELRARFVRCAEVVHRELLDSHRTREAVALARRVRATEPLRQHGWRLLLEALLAASDVVSALVECESLERMAAQEGIDLEPSTRGVVARVRRAGQVVPARHHPLVLHPELVGREREFALLMQAWDTASRGRPTSVRVLAQAGLGKSRLLSEFKARLQSIRARSVLVRANPGTAQVPFALAGDLAERLGGLPGARGVSPHSMQILVTLSPSLSSVFNATPLDSAPADGPRHRLIALKELIAAVAAEQPVAILIDDLHWSDPQSRVLLDGLCGAFDESPLLFCVASRGAEDIPATAHGGQSVHLGPLSEAAILSLVSGIASLPSAEWADRFTGELLRETRGVPLYIVESLQQALQEGLLALRDGMWCCDAPGALWQVMASGGVLRRRLAGLGETERLVLRTLAATAAPLDEHIIRQAIGVDDATASEALAGLQQKGLLTAGPGDVGIVHDEVSTLVAEDTPPDVFSTIEQRVGVTLAREAGSHPRNRRLAAALLHRARAESALRDLFQLHYFEARRRKDRRPRKALARDLLGDDAPTASIRSLARSVSVLDRFRASGTSRVAMVASVSFGLLGLVYGGAAYVQRVAAPPDGELVVEVVRPGGGIRFVAVPLRLDQWDVNIPIVVDDDARIVFDSPQEAKGRKVISPVGDGRMVAEVHVADSGGTELFLLSNGGREVRRLTSSPGDDARAAWSPDGRRIVFQTARWDSDRHSDLAVLDIETGRLARVTSTPSSEQSPLWSPDGTRIAFARKHWANRPPELCFTTSTGDRVECIEAPGNMIPNPVAWESDSSLLATVLRPGGLTTARIRASGLGVDVDTMWAGQVWGTSADGHWRVAPCHGDADPGSYCVFPAGRDDLARGVMLPAGAGPVSVTGRTRPRFVERLVVRNASSTAVVGIPFSFNVVALDASGAPVALHAATFRSLSPGGAIIEPDGSVMALRPGRHRFEVSAGGWRSDTVDINAVANPDTVIVRESWLSPERQWRFFGEPQPAVSNSDGGRPVLFLGGDGEYHGGAYLVAPVDAYGGISVRAIVSTPISSRQWQHLTISLGSAVDWNSLRTWDHRTGYIWGQMGAAARMNECAASYPPPYERPFAADSIELRSNYQQLQAPVLHSAGDGTWYELVLQLFPDGGCGLAIDGQPVLTTKPHVTRMDSVLVTILGNSVGTRILVGEIEVRRGVYRAIDWFGRTSQRPDGRDLRSIDLRQRSGSMAAKRP